MIKRRAELGLTQGQAAVKAGVARRTWQDIEAGGRFPMVTTLRKMDLALELPPGSLAACNHKPKDPIVGALHDELTTMVREIMDLKALRSLRVHVLRERLAALEAEDADHDDDEPGGGPGASQGVADIGPSSPRRTRRTR